MHARCAGKSDGEDGGGKKEDGGERDHGVCPAAATGQPPGKPCDSPGGRSSLEARTNPTELEMTNPTQSIDAGTIVGATVLGLAGAIRAGALDGGIAPLRARGLLLMMAANMGSEIGAMLEREARLVIVRRSPVRRRGPVSSSGNRK